MNYNVLQLAPLRLTVIQPCIVLQFQHAPGHLVGLLQIIIATNVDFSIRQIASIYFKNVIARDWSPRDTGPTFLPHSFDL